MWANCADREEVYCMQWARMCAVTRVYHSYICTGGTTAATNTATSQFSCIKSHWSHWLVDQRCLVLSINAGTFLNTDCLTLASIWWCSPCRNSYRDVMVDCCSVIHLILLKTQAQLREIRLTPSAGHYDVISLTAPFLTGNSCLVLCPCPCPCLCLCL